MKSVQASLQLVVVAWKTQDDGYNVQFLQLLEVQQNHDHDLWQWICKWHWLPRLENVTWKFSGQHQHNTIDAIFFIVFLFRYVSMFNPLCMVYICIMQHSKFANKMQVSVTFKVLMFLQVFCCYSFFGLWFFCFYSSFEKKIGSKVIYFWGSSIAIRFFWFRDFSPTSRLFCLCGFATCITHLFVALFIFVVSLCSYVTFIWIALCSSCEP
jgi:hypothetical protein